MSKIQWTDKLVTRFWSYVEKSDDGCWLWIGGCFTNGYGQFRAGTRKVKAHRAAHELMVGPIPEGKILCHRCDVPRCVRPDHLFIGTHADNSADRDRKGRRSNHLPTPRPGGANPAAKLSAADVASIRSLRLAGWTYRRLAEHFGTSRSQIGNIVRGDCWRVA